jgi:cation transport ATPase
LENLPKVRFFLADKTGTLTLGRPKISEIKIFSHLTRENFLKMVGAVAVCSHHPVDEAIVNYVNEHKIHIDVPSEFHETSGEGIIATFGSRKIIVGRLEFLENHGLVIPKKIKGEVKMREDEGYGVVGV